MKKPAMSSKTTLITDEIVERTCIAMHSAYPWGHFAAGKKELLRDGMRRTLEAVERDIAEAAHERWLLDE